MSNLTSQLLLSLPAILTLELTPACNNRCAGCSNVYTDRMSPPLPFSAWREMLAPYMPEMAQLRLSGGEPTLHPEFFELLDFTSAYDAAVTVFTNARWRDPAQFVEQFARRESPNLAGLLVSLHGAEAHSHEAFTGVSGSFAETCANIRLAAAQGISVMLSTILTHQSWNQIEQVLELAQTLGARSVAFNRYLGTPLPGIEPTKDELRAAQIAIERLIAIGSPVKYGVGVPQCFTLNHSGGCLAGVAYATLDPWGNLRPCNHSPTVVGSLRGHPLRELWHSEPMNAWRALMPNECLACTAYSICHGGCRAIQELRADQRDPLRQQPLADYKSARETKEIPANARPVPNYHIRQEPFGYILLGRGQVIPVAKEAKRVLDALVD